VARLGHGPQKADGILTRKVVMEQRRAHQVVAAWKAFGQNVSGKEVRFNAPPFGLAAGMLQRYGARVASVDHQRNTRPMGPAGHVDHHVSSSASDVQKPQRQTHSPVVADSPHMEDLPPYSCGHQRDPVHARQRPESRDVSRWIEILRVHELGLPMPAV
ncbi:uncharacterized protein METZ01_LOCUS11823, partial [marine metagenome]